LFLFIRINRIRDFTTDSIKGHIFEVLDKKPNGRTFLAPFYLFILLQTKIERLTCRGLHTDWPSALRNCCVMRILNVLQWET
jgi:hypothetical protein